VNSISLGLSPIGINSSFKSSYLYNITFFISYILLLSKFNRDSALFISKGLFIFNTSSFFTSGSGIFGSVSLFSLDSCLGSPVVSCLGSPVVSCLGSPVVSCLVFPEAFF